MTQIELLNPSEMVPDKSLKVLVTGGAGYIGSHTVLELLIAGHDVIIADDCSNIADGSRDGKPEVLSRVEKLTGKNVVFYKVSTMNKNIFKTIFEKHHIDVVMHFAALKAVGESVNLPLQYYSNNVTGTINLLTAMGECGVKNLVFSSSATVYGTPQYLPLDEEHPTGQDISNPYGKTKFMCEQIMKDLATSDKSWRIIFLRYFNPVGAHKSGLIGEDPKGIPNNLMPFLSQVAVGERPKLEVFGNDYDTIDGTGVRDYVHVVDLANGHVSALKKMLAHDFQGWKSYNLGTGKGVSVLEMIEAFSKACGKSLPYSIVGHRKGDLGTVLASCDLAKRELGWISTNCLKEMCEDTWRWQKNNPHGFSNTCG